MLGGIKYLGLGLVLGFVFCYLLSDFIFIRTIIPVFSPENGAEIIDLINNAENSIDIEMYVFTSKDVIEALERARNRGIKIRIILERDTIGGGNSETYFDLASKGFNIRYASDTYKLTHSKIMIIDDKIVFVGSHNFSNSAIYENREASVIINDIKTAEEFIRIFDIDWRLAA